MSAHTGALLTHFPIDQNPLQLPQTIITQLNKTNNYTDAPQTYTDYAVLYTGGTQAVLAKQDILGPRPDFNTICRPLITKEATIPLHMCVSAGICVLQLFVARGVF